jgi:transposase
MGQPSIAVELSSSEREQLITMKRSRSLPHSSVSRAKIVLMASEGYSNVEIAAQCSVTQPTVTNWKKRFAVKGLAGLYDEAKSGRPRTHDDEAVAELLNSEANTPRSWRGDGVVF